MSRLPEPNGFDRLEAGSKIQIRSWDTAYKRDFSAGISAQDLFLRLLLWASNHNVVIIAEKL
jgi:hypothetical protein